MLGGGVPPISPDVIPPSSSGSSLVAWIVFAAIVLPLATAVLWRIFSSASQPSSVIRRPEDVAKSATDRAA